MATDDDPVCPLSDVPVASEEAAPFEPETLPLATVVAPVLLEPVGEALAGVAGVDITDAVGEAPEFAGPELVAAELVASELAGPELVAPEFVPAELVMPEFEAPELTLPEPAVLDSTGPPFDVADAEEIIGEVVAWTLLTTPLPEP